MINHIYQEQNSKAYQLFKEAFMMEENMLQVTKLKENQRCRIGQSIIVF